MMRRWDRGHTRFLFGRSEQQAQYCGRGIRLRAPDQAGGELLGPVPLPPRKDPLLLRQRVPADLPLLRLRQGGRPRPVPHGDGEPVLPGRGAEAGGSGGPAHAGGHRRGRAVAGAAQAGSGAEPGGRPVLPRHAVRPPGGGGGILYPGQAADQPQIFRPVRPGGGSGRLGQPDPGHGGQGVRQGRPHRGRAGGGGQGGRRVRQVPQPPDAARH